jgi:hypothetical protein
MGLQLGLCVDLFNCDLKPDTLLLAREQLILLAFLLLFESVFHQGRDSTLALFDRDVTVDELGHIAVTVADTQRSARIVAWVKIVRGPETLCDRKFRSQDRHQRLHD